MIGKTILITGMAGFIASNFMIYMIKKYPECHFIAIDKISYCSSIKYLQQIPAKNFTFFKTDICNTQFLNHIFDTFEIEYIMHFAAYTHVDHSFGNSLEFTQNNVLGTHCLLEVAKNHKSVKKFIYVSTDEVYGNTNRINDENGMIIPTNPYAATKAAAEMIAMSYYKSFNLPVVITRGNNVYGPRQYPDKVVPNFIHAFEYGEKCKIQGDGHQVRSFVYVEDVVEAFDIVLQKGEIGNIYNIGINDEYEILDLVKILHQQFELKTEWISHIEYIQDRCFNDKRYAINTDKLNGLGWTQKTRLHEGLAKTIKWYRENQDYWEK
jgi:dTDP-glucose 4,6-dehydratase